MVQKTFYESRVDWVERGQIILYKYIYWQDGEYFLGHFVDYPDYLTQEKSLEELKENLRDLYADFMSNEIPYIRKIDEYESFIN